jgi:hypothetical protein
MAPMRAYAVAACVLVLSGCRGAAAIPQAPAPAQPAAAQLPAAATVGGVVNTTTWGVASGKTVTVTKNLAVFARTSITIAGTLVVPRGIQAAFFTPSFTIAQPSGRIVTAKNKKWGGPVDDFVSACQIDIQPQGGVAWEAGAGDDLGFTSNRKQHADPKHPCTAVVGAEISMDPAAKGGSDKKHPNGQDGGSIVIGTKAAIALTQALAKRDGHRMSAYAPDVVELDWPLRGASGGDGKDDRKGSSGAAGVSFTGTNGGIGGGVQISAGSITGSQPDLFGGNGGSGGTLGLVFWRHGYASNPLNGTLASPNARSLTIVQGAGGGGGSILVDAKKTPSKSTWQPGSGGNPSTFYGLAYVGSGYYDLCTNCIYAGSGFSGLNDSANGTSNGGDAELDLASVGKKGVGDRNDSANRPVNGTYGAAISVTGGYGGVYTTGVFNTGVPGGNGASLTILPPKHVAITSLKQFGFHVQLYQFGNGAAGVYWCPDTPPATGSGFAGGNGGDLHDNGLMDLITILPYAGSSLSKSSSFNGGSGSNGNPPAAGGKGGVNDEGDAVGEDGTAGNAC